MPPDPHSFRRSPKIKPVPLPLVVENVEYKKVGARSSELHPPLLKFSKIVYIVVNMASISLNNYWGLYSSIYNF